MLSAICKIMMLVDMVSATWVSCKGKGYERAEYFMALAAVMGIMSLW